MSGVRAEGIMQMRIEKQYLTFYTDQNFFSDRVVSET